MITVNENELYIGEIPVSRLVQTHGEPAYIYDAEVIEQQYRRLKAALPPEIDIFYSLKANPNISIAAFLGRLVRGAEVSSLRELFVAQKAGFSPERILFVGPSKSENELREAISKGIFCLVAESEAELGLIDEIAGKLGRQLQVAIRINPAFDTAGSRLKMGGSACQFGIDEEGIEDLIKRASQLEHVRIVGIHAYLGTRILDHEVAWKNTRYILELGRRIKEQAGVEIKVIDFGGGLGIPYFEGEHEFDLEAFGQQFRLFFNDYKESMPNTRFIMELGRYLVALSGVYVSKVRYVKTSRDKTFVLIGGGMNHHQATTSIGTLIKNHFPIEVLNKMSRPKDEIVTVCGPLCTPSDVLGKGVKATKIEPGDLIGILRSGAYGLTASPIKFLSHDHPVEVMVYQGTDHLIRRESRVEEILDHQFLVSVPLAAAHHESEC